MKPRIALLGLGTMGAGMASRLLASGFPLVVYNRNAAKAAALASAGAVVAATPRAAAVGADFVFGMLADDAASRTVWLGADGALAGLRRGAIAVECSTLSPGWIHELHTAVGERGGDFLDCPVTGSKNEAANGGLRFLAGGDASVLARAQSVLGVLGSETIPLGPVGSGTVLKLLNNSLNAVHVAAFAQALAFLERTAIDRDHALALLLSGAAASPIVKAAGPRMIARDYRPFFGLGLMAKDLRYALAEATVRGQPLPFAEQALAGFAAAEQAGWGEQDFSAVIEPLRPSAP